ncbi:MAG: MotA/TolQ/ExbB proton channel family protein [Rudaea sp.]|jgi:biopolymer transport protein ExbB|uniref:MotA/TolQ/ExbB proton channel family protein n=1 Tax=unclassified Rudaea TaxID=2627037 RepID=UPI0010F63BD2|nr:MULTISPECIES: MotA/TolQ/ExbB proton channel family protein [unclassified Rudaea]MBN8885321.1 MotA/TolQ/ExbB proton channel family protein [Rudaea sp.]MBR0347301.1 MotA/TolQ/ExbB proton channel family protein [Rudaea sp.]
MLQEAASAPVAGQGNAAALTQMGFEHLLHNFDTLGLVVFVTLVIMSLGSVFFIIVNAWRMFNIRRRGDSVREQFFETKSLTDAKRHLEEQPGWEPFSKIALDVTVAAEQHSQAQGSRLAETLNRSEYVDRALRQGVARESGRLETGLTWLATTGSTAPFVGLLGTVWGIYHALLKIGASGNASMDAVAGPVGEALIMTTIGLGVAIPAVLAYNVFNRANRVTLGKFDEFAHDLHDFFVSGSRVEGK